MKKQMAQKEVEDRIKNYEEVSQKKDDYKRKIIEDRKKQLQENA